MDAHEASSITFLDLSGVDEQERTRVLASLHAENSCVWLPWIASNRKQKDATFEKLTDPRQQAQIINHNRSKVVTTGQSEYVSAQVDYTPYIKQDQELFPSPPIYQVPITYSPQPSHYVVYPTIPTTYPQPFFTLSTTNIPKNFVAASEPIILNSDLDLRRDSTEAHVEIISKDDVAPELNTSIPKVDQQRIVTSPTADIVNQDSVLIRQHNDVCGNNSTSGATHFKSWASLFNSSKALDSANNNNSMCKSDKPFLSEAVKETNNNGEDLCPIRHPRKTQFVDPNCYRIGEFLLKHVVDGKTISLQPRGLINRSNYCYINSILQALLACAPAYNLLVKLSLENTSSEMQKVTPIMNGMCRFVKEFQHLPAGLRVNRKTDKSQKKDQGIIIDCDLPFEPSWIYKMLNGVRSDSFLVEGRQEDAEEFLGFLLNGLNDEMVEIMKLVKNDLTVGKFQEKHCEQDEKDWQVIGPKNKGGITRQIDFIKTPISDIFGGFLKSRIHRTGDHSTYNIQPFFTLQLNIEKVNSVHEALDALVIKNQLEGFTSEKTNEEVEAWQQVTLEELPVILILHLKCFDFKLNGCTKIIKALNFPIDLKIDSKLLSSKTVTPKEKQYKLFAVVYHDGKEATKGHYITDAFHVGYSSWIRYDDASVKAINEEQVLKPQGTRVPYLLFYRRSDIIRSK